MSYTDEFPHTVQIFSETEVRLPGGDYEVTPVLFNEVTCFISPLTDVKVLQAMNKTDKTIYVLLMHYGLANGITSDMLVNHDGIEGLKFIGPGKDLGGQREIMRYVLELV